MIGKLRMKDKKENEPWAGCSEHRWRHLFCPYCQDLIGNYNMYRKGEADADAKKRSQ